MGERLFQFQDNKRVLSYSIQEQGRGGQTWEVNQRNTVEV